MIKTVIIEHNKDLIIKLIKHFEMDNQINVVFSTSDGLEGLNYIIHYYREFDVIVMNLIINNKDGISILRELKERNINKPVIICSSCHSEKMINQASNFNICAYLLKPYDYKDLDSKIIDAMKKESCSKKVDEKIVYILHSLGIPTNYKGYKYLKESIRMGYNYSDFFITKDIYIKLADKYKVSKSSIERDISRAIDIGFTRNDCDYVEYVFGNTINYNRGSPTNSEFIKTIIERLSILK